LTRLSSFDARNIYVRFCSIAYAHRMPVAMINMLTPFRFGQSVLQDCEYCHTYDEYALYALPRPLLEYVRETAVVGFLTINGSHKERWRTAAIGAIVCAAVAEGYWVSTAQVKISRSGLGVVMVRGTQSTHTLPHPANRASYPTLFPSHSKFTNGIATRDPRSP